VGEEGKRIQAVVNSAKNSSDVRLLKTWGNYLEKYMKFPFESVVEEYQGKLLSGRGRNSEFFGVKLVDDHYGVIVSCKSEHSRFDIPLADIACC